MRGKYTFLTLSRLKEERNVQNDFFFYFSEPVEKTTRPGITTRTSTPASPETQAPNLSKEGNGGKIFQKYLTRDVCV